MTAIAERIRRKEKELDELREQLDFENAGAPVPAPARAWAPAQSLSIKARTNGWTPHRSFWTGRHAESLLRVAQILEICREGVLSGDGELVALTPSAKDVLLVVMSVLLRLHDFRGTMDSETLARELNMSRRTAQLALAELEGLGLIIVEREKGATRRISLAGWLMEPRRPRRRASWIPPGELSTGLSNLGTTALPAKISSPPICTHQNSWTCESPLTPLARQKGVGPAGTATLLLDGERRAGPLSRENDHDETATAQGGLSDSGRPALDVPLSEVVARVL